MSGIGTFAVDCVMVSVIETKVGLGHEGTRLLAGCVALAAAMMSAGCADIHLIPASGPDAITVKGNATLNGPPYGLVKLTPKW